MADFGSPVVGPQTAVNPMQTLSQVLSIQQQKQALQGQAAVVQQEQQTASQRAGIASFMQHFDPTQHVGPDGTLDLDQVLTDPKLRQAAGDQFPDLMAKMVQVKQAQLGAKQQLVNLNDSTRTQFLSMLGGLRTDADVIADNPAGREKVERAIGQFSATGPDAARIAQIYGTVLQHTPPGRLAGALSNAQLQAMDASTQAGRQAPTYLGTGAQAVNVNPQAAGGNITSTPNVRMSVPPGMSTFTDQGGNTWAVNPQNPGHAILLGHGGSLGGGGGGAEAKPSATPAAPPTLAPGEADIVKQATDRVGSIRQQASDARTQLDILNRIQALAKVTPTGHGMDTLARYQTLAGQLPGMEGLAQKAQNFNELTKFLAQNAARQGGNLGLLGSDARLDLAQHANPNTEMDPTTIGRVAQYQAGLVRMNKAKADALDTWLSQPGNTLQKEAEFEKTWRESADPRLFQMAEMQDQGEKVNYAALHIKKSEVATLAQKHKQLVALGALSGNE